MDGLDRDAVTTRLRRIEGQVRGVERMVGEERNCEDVLTQLMAVRSGLEQVWVMLVDAHIRDCLLADAKIAPARLEEISQTLKLWTRFGAPATQLPD